LLLVESPLVLSVIRKLEGQAADYHYPHTNTEENIRFFSQYLNFGFDLQEDCRYREFSAYLVQEGYLSAKDRDLMTMDSLLSLLNTSLIPVIEQWIKKKSLHSKTKNDYHVL
jgi:hypothetical protein